MRKVGNLPTMIAKFTTDIPSLTNWGEPFLLGPGSIHVAHTPDEKISKQELLDAVDLYCEPGQGTTGLLALAGRKSAGVHACRYAPPFTHMAKLNAEA